MKKTTWLILGIALLVIVLDQASKYLVATYLPLGGAWSPFPAADAFFQIVYTFNTGVAFGLFKDLGPLFILVALVVIGVIIVYVRRLSGNQWLLCVALGLMLGGAIGNLIDRIRLGHVIDFLDVGVGTTRWYTSNLADVSIVLGVILLGFATVRDERKHQQRQPDRRDPVPGDTETPRAQS